MLINILNDNDVVFYHDIPGNIPVSDALNLIAQNFILAAVVGFSEKRLAKSVVSAIKAGAIDYIFYPLDYSEIATDVERILHDHSARERDNLSIADAIARIANLSPREREVLDLLYEGMTNKEMARALGLSPRTIEIHRTKMLTKLGVRNSTHALKLKFLSTMCSLAA